MTSSDPMEVWRSLGFRTGIRISSSICVTLIRTSSKSVAECD